jgi:hypothetical protein
MPRQAAECLYAISYMRMYTALCSYFITSLAGSEAVARTTRPMHSVRQPISIPRSLQNTMPSTKFATVHGIHKLLIVKETVVILKT